MNLFTAIKNGLLQYVTVTPCDSYTINSNKTGISLILSEDSTDTFITINLINSDHVSFLDFLEANNSDKLNGTILKHSEVLEATDGKYSPAMLDIFLPILQELETKSESLGLITDTVQHEESIVYYIDAHTVGLIGSVSIGNQDDIITS